MPESHLPCNQNVKPFLADIPMLYHLKTFGFLVFLGGLKWEHWPEMG